MRSQRELPARQRWASLAARSWIAGLAFASLAMTGVVPAAMAQNAYPEHAVNLIVAFNPGGTNDILARLVASKLSVSLGQNFIVVNKPGAGGNIGTEYVARSAPDGYNLVLDSTGPIAVNPTLYKPMSFSTMDDLVPVILVAKVPNILVVSPALPIHNFAEFVSYAKQHPGAMNYGSTGIGTSSHLSSYLLMSRLGVPASHIPYKGADGLNDVMAGRVQFMFDTVPSLIGQVRAGRLRAIAVSSETRSSAAPNVPTVIESGVPGFETDSWFGIFAPKGTPKAVVERLNAAVNGVLPGLKDQMVNLGAVPVGGSPESFAAFARSEEKKWGAVVISSHASAG